MSNSPDEIPPIVHALAGAVASAISNTVVYPLDLITTRLQTQEKQGSQAKKSHGRPLTHEKTYDGLAHAFLTIYEDEGVSAMWEGVVPDNLSTMASTFCYHFAYNFVREHRFEQAAKRMGGKRPRVLGMVEELSIGALAGVIARFVTSPASNVVTRSQTQGGSTRDICRSIYEEKGITGFWSGMKASVILAANPSISFYLFELQKALLIPKARRDSPKAIEIFLMSATGKAIATLLLYPIILVKAKTQALRVKIGFWNLVKSILEKDGLAGLYAGAVPQVFKGFLSQGIMMLLKDRIGGLIISGYLAVNKTRRRSAEKGFHYADTPKTDVNGLIAATKDTIEVAVDNAVEKVKEVASDLADASHVGDLVEAGRNATQNAMDKSGGTQVVASAKEAVNSVVDTATSMTNAGMKSATNALDAGKDAAENFMSSDKKEVISSTKQDASNAWKNAANLVSDVAETQGRKAQDLLARGKDASQKILDTNATEHVSALKSSADQAAHGATDSIKSAVNNQPAIPRDLIDASNGSSPTAPDSSDKPVRAISNAIAQGDKDMKKG